MSDNPLLAAFTAKSKPAPKPTGNPLLDSFSEQQASQQGFDFGDFKPDPGSRPVAKQIGAAAMKRSLDPNTGDLGKGNPLPAGPDSWADTGRKFANRIVPLLKQSLAGLAQGTVEGGAPNMPGMTPQENEALAAQYTAAVTDLSKQGRIPGQKMYAAAQKDLEANGYNPGDSMGKKYAAMIAESGVQMLPAIAATLSTRNPMIGAAAMGAQVGGQQYGESRADGRTPGQASMDAAFMAASETLGEEIPLGFIMKKGGKFLANTLRTAGAEGIQEVFTQILQTGYDKGVLHPDMTWAEARQQVIDAGIVGFGMGAGMHVAAAPFVSKEDPNETRRNDRGINGDAAAAMDPNGYNPGDVRQYAAPLTNAAPSGIGQKTAAPVAPAAPATPADATIASLAPVAAVRPRGVIEGAATDAAQLSQADIDSPIPNDVIAQGKAELARATAAPAANGILSSAGLPEVGGRVSINWNGTTIGGKVLDAFDTDAGPSGRAQGVRIQRDDGTMLEEHFDTLRDLGVQIAPEVATSSPAAVSTTPAAAPGGGGVSAAPVSTNGFVPAPKGYRVKVSGDTTLKGAINVQKRSADGQGSGFYVGTDGVLIDADTVVLNASDIGKRIWVDGTPEQRAKAIDIVERMQQLELGTPARRELQAELKALVTGTAPAQVAADRPTPGGIPGFMAKVGRAESPNDTAKNPRSSAEGRYQFTDGTFEATYRSVFGDTGETREQILAKKTDGKLQDRLMNKLTQDNTNALRKAGFQPTDGNRYLAHFAGSGGAVKLLSADPNATAESVLGAKVIEANPFLRGKTAGETVAWAAKKMGGPAGRGVDMAAAGAIDVNDDATPVQFKDMDWGDEASTTGSVTPTGDGSSSAPIAATTDDNVTTAAARVAEPTEAQKEAGNYAKGHVTLHGLDIAIETPRGATRSGTDGGGKRWSVEMPDHYGYVKRTTGADGDQVDVYVGPKPESQKVYVIDQVDAKTGAFDEHKAMLGYETRTAALKAYHAAFSDGRGGDRVGAVTDTDVAGFKGWLDGGATDKPMGFLDPVRAANKMLPNGYTFAKDSGGALFLKGPNGQIGTTLASPGLTGEKLGNAFADGIKRARAAAGPAETQQASTSTAGSPAPTFTDTPSGKGVAVGNLTDEQKTIIARDVPKAKGVANRDGAIVFSKKQEDAIRAALASAAPAGQEAGSAPAPTLQAERDRSGGDRGATSSNDVPDDLLDAINALDLDQYVAYLDELKPPKPTSKASTSRAYQVAYQFSTRGEAAMRAALAKVTGTSEQQEDAAFLRVWQSPAFKAAIKSIGTMPHRESPVAHQTVRGWQDGKARDLESLMQFENSDSHVSTLSEARKGGGTGWNPEVAYIEGFYAAVMPEAREVRAIKTGNKMGARDAIDAIANVLDPQSAPTPPSPPTAPAPTPNRLVSDDRAAELRARLKGKLNQLNSGIDPEVLAIGAELAVYHIEKGARRFVAFARTIAADLQMELPKLKPYLRSWFNGARDMMEDHGANIEGMDGSDDVAAAMRMFDQWADAGVPTAPAQETTDGLQGTVPAGDGGSGTADAARATEDGSAGRLRAEAVGGGARAVRGTDEGRSQDAVGRGDRSGEAADRGAERARPDAGLPATRAGVSASGRGVAAGNFTIAPGALDEARGPKAKALDNLAAIETLKTLQREGRPASAEEQQQLARYVGWGGLKNVFPDGDGAFGKGFEDVGRRLRDLLTSEEYDTARRSIQYAHYTSETIVREMWRGAQALGFTGGSVFEPGMGTGNFAGMMPPALASNVRYSGIEMDAVTAGIAKALYPQSGVAQADYTQYDAPKDAYDLVIGNPPFSETVIKADPAYKTKGFVLHDYFFAKSLDSVKPGGLLMFVTSAGTMNKLDTKAREYLAARADLVGAIRLPGDAFEQNAGTKVTTDIIVLRKRMAGETAGDQTWIETTSATLPTKDGTPKEGNVSRYFAEHPEQVLGEQGFFDPLYPERYAVRRDRGDNTPFAGKLAAAIDRLGTSAAQVVDTTPPPRAPADLDFDSNEKKNGSFYLNDKGVLHQQTGNVGMPVSSKQKGAKGGLSATDQEKVKALVPIRDALRDIYRHDLNERGAEADAARANLNSLYDAFVAKHGPINKGVFTRRRPSRVTIESARRKAREEARARGFEWEDGTFDAETMFDQGATLAQVAAAREEARADAQRRGQAWDEGTFDPEDVPDTVLEKRPNIDAFMDDPESYRLRSIEHYNDSTGEAAKGPVFFQNVVSRQGDAVIKTPVDALYHALNLTGRVDLDHIGRLVGLSPSDVVDQLAGQIYRTPEGEWQQSAKYLSGDVRKKLAAAEAAAANDPALRGNVEALRAVVPADLGKTDVRATLGMNWINPTHIEDFGKALGLARLAVKYQPITASWSVSGDRSSAAATSTWGTERRSASELIDDALNGKSPKIYDQVKDLSGNTTSVLNQEATQAAGDKLIAIKDRFKSWIWEDDARAESLLRIYNDTFNSLVAPSYDGSYMTTPGVSALWSWRPHQTGVMARIVQEGNTYMAHAVGAGKTSAMIGAGMEMKRLGLVNKPMYVVPNHMLAQFTKEFYEQYPTARIMVADDDRNFITDKRKQFVSDMALADIDAVIIKHSAFGLIPLSSEFQKGMLDQQLRELRETLNAVDKGERQTRRKIEQMVEQTEQRIRAVTSGKKDQTFTFEETGVDFLFVDEAHLFRKLDFVTNRGDVKGIDPTGSMRSMDLFMKTRMLEGRRPGRSHVLASGTPITNTMAELYSISRYLQPDTLRERGIDRFDAWASGFGDTVTDLEPTAGGTYKPVTRFSQFVNVPELSAMVRQVMDVVTPEQLEQYVTRPAVRNHMVVVPESPGQAAYRAQLQARMEAIEKRKGPPKKGDDIMLSVINDGRNAAIDMRLVDPSNDEERTKLMEAIENVARVWKETTNHPFYEITDDGYSEKPAFHAPAAQMVFASRGVGAGRAFNVHRFMVDELVKRGVPREEMVIFNALKNDVAKQRVFNDMKVGKVRILLGSVDKMGTGVNAQRLLAANHNMDPEWLPSSDEQRNGRIIRQGNLNKSVDIYNYSTKGTYDSAMWGMMGRKAKFIEGFFRGDPTLRDMEDLGEASKYEQAKALTTRDPRILVLTEAKQELEKELRRRSAFESDIANAAREERESNRYAARLERSIVNERADAAQREDISGDKFTATLGDSTFTERAAFQEALNDMLGQTPTREAIVEIGKLGGFTLAREDYKQVTFGDEGKQVKFYSQPILLLNGDDASPEGERRYKELAKTGTAASAQTFLGKLDRVVSDTQADIERYRQRAADFAKRANDKGEYAGQDRIDELTSQVGSIEAELTAETKAAEAARSATAAPAPAEAEAGVKYSLMGEQGAEPATPDLSRLRERMEGLGISDRVTLDVVDRIANDPKIAGQYWQRAITVATAAGDGAYVVDHEAIHAIRELGLFRPSEWSALTKAAKADTALMEDVRSRYGDRGLTDEDLTEEAVADMFARWRQGREATGFVRTAFQRLGDFLDALRKLFGGGPTGGGTMRDIESGTIGSRDAIIESLLNPAPFYSRVQPPAAQPSAHEFGNAESEKRWKKATEGLGTGPGLLLRVKTNLANIGNGFARHWEHLPNLPKYAALQQKLRGLEAAPQAARERAVAMLSDMVKGFTREDLDLLARKVVLDDLIWEADQDHDLPFGLTPTTLRAEKQRVDAIVDAQPGRKVWGAAMKRKIVNRQIATELVNAGVLDAERVKNPSYFRHQVLEYARTEARLAQGQRTISGKGPRLRSPMWAKRMGSSLDINANLLEAEFDWLNKALTDIPTASAIDWIKKSEHNILDRLKKQAKDTNEQGITDLIAKEKDRDGPVTSQEREFKGRFGYGFKVIRDELDAGTIRNIPASLKRAADAIQSGQKDGDPPFAFLSWLLDNDQPGGKGAAIILKAVGEKRSFRKEVLGDKYVDPDDAEALVSNFAPEGYATWQPEEGKLLFTVKTLPEHAIDAMLQHLDNVPAEGVDATAMRAQLEKQRNAVAVGGDKYKMILPTEVVETLNQLRRPDVEGLIGQIFAVPLAKWKQWVLINPRRIIKYNLNNLSGDLDAVLAGNPRLLRRTPEAARELASVMRGKAQPSARYQEAVARGVFDSGLSVQEIPDINRLSAFTALTQPASNRPDKIAMAGIGKTWRSLQGFTQWRENVFRYAAYLDYADRIEAGEPMAKIGYGASVPKMVDAVTDLQDKAALLARDLMGDYGAISANGAWLRSHLIPFWSWTELNTKRYWRLTANAWGQGAGKGLATGGALAVSRGAATSVALGLRMAMIYGLINLWNWLMFDDEEKELSSDQQHQLHIILGKNDAGEVVTLRTQGAFSDIMGLFGYADAADAIRAHEEGRGSVGAIVGAVAKAPVNRLATSGTPLLTIPLEAATGKKLWPDIFNARTIRDRTRNTAQAFSLENEYDAAMGLPSRGYGKSITDSVVYRRQPGEIAYDEARGLAYDWNKRTKGSDGSSDFSTPRSNAMRDYRTALRYGDEGAAAKALDEMGGYGVTEKDLAGMVKRADPLGPIAKKDRAAFLDSLTSEELQKFARADEWYRATFQ